MRCVQCGAPVTGRTRWCDECVPVEAATERAPLKVPSEGRFPQPADGADLHVDDFPDGLVPFVGDPRPSRVVGGCLQVLCALLAAAMVLRAVPSLDVWNLARKGSAMSVDEVLRLGSSMRRADDTAAFAWVFVVPTAVLLAVFERVRRPRARLAAEGEAHVEASWTTFCPRSRAVAIGVLATIGVLGALVPRIGLDSMEAIAVAYLGLAATSVCLAIAFVLVLGLVRASRRQLERRVAVGAGLGPDEVPFVAPRMFPVDEQGREGRGPPG